MGIMALFVGHRCYVGFRSAQAMLAVDRLPRHAGFACAECGEPPPSLPVWLCAACGQRFDAFATRGVCPHCRTVLPAIACVHCATAHPVERWEKFPGRRPPRDATVIDV
jgi:DNA-directed RNA polymerase subunit RPC12/RpoP